MRLQLPPNLMRMCCEARFLVPVRCGVSRMLLQSHLTFTQISEIAENLSLACYLVHSQIGNRSNSLHSHVPGVFGL